MGVIFSMLFTMTATQTSTKETIRLAKELMDQKTMDPAVKACLMAMILLLELLLERLGLNSKNSSKPPSTDPDRKKKSRSESQKKPGGQPGHVGSTLNPVPNPDKIETIEVDRSTLPPGTWTTAGYESRQVFDLDIAVVVTEYRAEILKNSIGEQYTAKFPEFVKSPVQYGTGVIAHVVYLSQHQLLPYDRLREYGADQLGLPFSMGTINNFNEKMYGKLDWFPDFVKQQLVQGKLMHSDETGLNIDKKLHWEHVVSNEHWTYLMIHKKRGKKAMDSMDILPRYRGTVHHDHWKAYYRYEQCDHALCNAHHLRELTWSYEQDHQSWAKKMGEFLLAINQERNDLNRIVPPEKILEWTIKYREVITEGEKECPPPEPNPDGKRGRCKRSKSRNLLERLQKFESDVLRFLNDPSYEFTNNQAEQDLRMTKVHQKISGYFKSFHGAEIYCRIRSYLSSAIKQGFTASYALEAALQGKNIFSEIRPE